MVMTTPFDNYLDLVEAACRELLAEIRTLTSG